MLLTLFLWTQQGEMPHALGAIEAIRIDVAAPLGGILKPPLPQGQWWALYDTVEKGQPLALLDNKPLQAEMATLVQELGRLKKEIDAVRARLAVREADRGLTYISEAVRLYVELAQRTLVALERQAEVAVNRIESQRRTVYYNCLKPLYDKKIVSELELNNARYLRDEAVERLAESTKVAGEAETQKKIAKTRLDEAETQNKSDKKPLDQMMSDEKSLGQATSDDKRLDQLPKFLPADIAKELAPITAAVQVQEAKIKQVQAQIDLLTISSPVHGMISAINHWPQTAIKAGDPIVTIASDERRYLVCYVRQEQHVNPEVGMDVDVRKRAVISPTIHTVVERVGAQIELIPEHICRDPKYPEWGVPIRITLPEGFVGRPGELFEVTFKTRSKNNAK